jgi:hypothetical protein
MDSAVAVGLEASLLVHLNLNEASLAVAERGALIRDVYGPLLALSESRPWLVLTLEASGHTLERLAQLAPEWLAHLSGLLADRRVAFVGSGDTRLAAPLVPAAVNRWNQALGREAYQRLLGRLPRCAFVNHMAWSQGLVDAYLDAGYEAVITSPSRLHGSSDGVAWAPYPAWTLSPSGRRMRLLSAPAEVAGGLERFLSGALGPEHVLAELANLRSERARRGPRAHVTLSLYGLGLERARGVDAPALQRLGELCDALHARGLAFTSPEDVLDESPREAIALSEPDQVVTSPHIPLARFALGGWDAPGVNARCFARGQELEQRGATARDWQLLCRAWASDLRADLRPERWQRFARTLPKPAVAPASDFPDLPLRVRIVEQRGSRLALATEGVRVVLDLRRGLALDGLSFHRTGEEPLIGAMPRSVLEPGASLEARTSGHCEFAAPGGPAFTDLVPAEPEVEGLETCLCVRAALSTPRGRIVKEVRVFAQRLELRTGFSALGPRASVRLRAGFLTFLPSPSAGPWLSCANGGAPERFDVSCLAQPEVVLGASDGWVALDDGRRGFEVSWPQARSAPLPVLLRSQARTRTLLRLAFALAEPDETVRAGGTFPDLELSIRPCRNRR